MLSMTLQEELEIHCRHIIWFGLPGLGREEYFKKRQRIIEIEELIKKDKGKNMAISGILKLLAREAIKEGIKRLGHDQDALKRYLEAEIRREIGGMFEKQLEAVAITLLHASWAIVFGEIEKLLGFNFEVAEGDIDKVAEVVAFNSMRTMGASDYEIAA